MAEPLRSIAYRQSCHDLDWGAEELRAEYAALTVEAVRDSVAAYTPLGDVPPAYIVYTWDRDYSSPQSAGAAMAALFNNPCRLAVFPLGANELSAGGAEVFKHLLAHEMFHCFQNQNLVYHPGTYDANAWWVEGTAEHFSNVVYPDVNIEHRFAADFDARSVSHSLVCTGDTLELSSYPGIFVTHTRISP